MTDHSGNGDKSAFPTIQGVQNMPAYLGGMTKRELIATHIAAGLARGTYPKECALLAVEYADDLLAELAK